MLATDAPAPAPIDANHPAALEPSDPPPPSRTDILAIELAAISRGVVKGRAQGLAQGVVALCDVLEIPLDADRLAVMERLQATDLEALLDAIRADRCWP